MRTDEQRRSALRRTARAAEDKDPRTDSELLDQTRTDGAAFGVFYARHATAMFAYFRPRCYNTQEAYDLTAETFAQALRGLAKFDPRRGDPGGWLFGIAQNTFRRFLRQGRVDERARQRLGVHAARLSTDQIADLEHRIDLTDSRSRLVAAIDDLPTDLANAVRLRFFHSLPYDEIAVTLDITPPAARQRVVRGLERLASDLDTNPFLTHD